MGRYNTHNLNLFSRMKKILLTCFVLLGLQLNAQIETGTVGAGLSLGSPSGFSFKTFNSETEAYQFTLGYNMSESNLSFNLGADLLRHNYNYVSAAKARIGLYYGLGVHLSVEEETTLLARLPLGLTYEFKDFPADIFIEAAPGIAVWPSPAPSLTYGIGARYYFDPSSFL